MLPYYGNGRKKRAAGLILRRGAAAATAPSWAAAPSVGFTPHFPPSTQSAPRGSTGSRRSTSRKVRGAAKQQRKQLQTALDGTSRCEGGRDPQWEVWGQSPSRVPWGFHSQGSSSGRRAAWAP